MRPEGLSVTLPSACLPWPTKVPTLRSGRPLLMPCAYARLAFTCNGSLADRMLRRALDY